MASTDRAALVALFQATDGASWFRNTNWDTDVELSKWHGVQVGCEGRVVSLWLANNNLHGPIPPELGNLGALMQLGLHENELAGIIPTTVGALTKLELLGLHQNQLTGRIPTEVGVLRNLEALWLNDNKLCGPIPKELGALIKLQKLVLSANQLAGAIPPELGNLGALTRLSLSENSLTGIIPPELGHLCDMKKLSLWGNELGGHTPKQLGALNNLQELVLSAIQLSGAIPPELGNLKALKRLSLSENRLTGRIPPGLGALSKLEKLWLNKNKLDGPIPKELGALSKLKELVLSANQLVGPIPPELGNLDALKKLLLWENKVTGSIPPELGNLGSLKRLSLGANGLTGIIPKELGALTRLERLSLHQNQLSGPIPPELGNLGALKELSLRANELSGKIPKELGALANLEVLLLHKNQLTGSIPKELGNLHALMFANLFDNKLIGAPNQLMTGGSLTQWQEKLRGAGHKKPWTISLVEYLVALWHFLLPIVDDVTDMILLYAAFEHRGGLWAVCCVAFALADAERVLLLFITLLLVLCWVPFAVLGTDESRGPRFQFVFKVLNGWHDLRLEPVFVRYGRDGPVWGSRPSALRWPIFDGFMWVVVGSRSKSSSLMALCGMAGDTPVDVLEKSGFGLSLIDRIVQCHPYSMLGGALFSCPYGHQLPGSGTATRRSWVMLRAVGETLVVDSLFLALSVSSSETWEDGVSIGVVSLIFSVLELVTELQYYAAEASSDMVVDSPATGGEDVSHLAVESGGMFTAESVGVDMVGLEEGKGSEIGTVQAGSTAPLEGTHLQPAAHIVSTLATASGDVKVEDSDDAIV